MKLAEIRRKSSERGREPDYQRSVILDAGHAIFIRTVYFRLRVRLE
jgi:hypothetical protein